MILFSDLQPPFAPVLPEPLIDLLFQKALWEAFFFFFMEINLLVPFPEGET